MKKELPLAVAGVLLLAGCGSEVGLGESNQAPNAVFSNDYGGSDAPVTVNFDASASSDPDGTIVSYEWDFDSAVGNFTPDATGVTVSHQFDFGGTYLVALRVTDDKGKVSIATVTLNINGNQRPSASVSADTTSGAPPLTVNFDATGSSDPDGSITAYEWDFSYDGTTFNVEGTGSTISYNFTADGTYTVAVRVTDDGTPAATDIATIDITVSSGPVNNPPSVDSLTADNQNPTTYPVDVTITATYSDPDGDTPLTIEWDDNYNWTTFNPNSNYTGLDQITLTFTSPGTYDIAFRVTDPGGLSDLATIRISVGTLKADLYIADDTDDALAYRAPGAPVQIDSDRQAGWPTDWPWFSQPDHPTVYAVPVNTTIYFHDASTPTSLVSSWQWDFDGTNGDTQQNPTYTYTTPGIYLVKLVINSGQSNECVATAVVAAYDPTTQAVACHPINESVTGDYGTYIDAGNPDTTMTTTAAMRLYKEISLTYHTLISTDVTDTANYPALTSTQVVQAGLVLNVCRENSVDGSDELNVYRITIPWDDNTDDTDGAVAATWTNIIGADPSNPVGVDYTAPVLAYTPFDFGPENEVLPYKPIFLDLTALVKAWIDGPSGGGYDNYGVILMIDDINGKLGNLTFMQAGRTSDYQSHYLEPCMVILYNQ